MTKPNYNLSSLEGRRNRIHGLMLAAQLIAAKEKIKAEQLKLFDNLKSEDTKVKM
jgi:hypothetical protein